MTAAAPVVRVVRKTVEHHYEPRGAAKALFEYRGKQVLLAGPAGTGKSRAALEKIHFMCLLNPGMRALLLRKTHRSLTTSGLVTWRERVAKEGLKHGVLKWFGGSGSEAAAYRYKNGSIVVVGGLDDPDKVMSTEYDVIFIQEATEVTEDDWEACTSRLRNGVVSFQQLIADCNPDRETHWLNQRCIAGRTHMLHSRHEDNPIYFDDAGVITERGRSYIEGVLDQLTGVRYLRLRKGIWAAAEGLVYEAFDPTVHVIESMPAGWETWQRWWSVDFGYSNPFVLQCWAEDGDGRLYLYREIYMSGRLVEDHARTIRKLVQRRDGTWLEPRPRSIVCDHNAEDRATLERHLGMSTTAAKKAPTAGQRGLVGLQQCEARFAVQPDKRARVFFLRDCTVEIDKRLRDQKLPTSTVEEIPGYVWPPDARSPDQREHPVKKDDHGMDAMRYLVAERDMGSRPRVRVM